MVSLNSFRLTTLFRPDYDELVAQVKPVMATEWRKFGAQLGVSRNAIEKIKKEEQGLPNRLSRMLSVWMRDDPKGDWGDIAKALEAIGHHELAAEIQRKYINKKEFRSHSKDIKENTVRHHFNELSNKIAASSDLLSSVTAGFYKYGIIDQNTKDEVNRKGGLAGAEMLLNHTQLKIKQSQLDGLAVLGSVINVLFDQGSLRDIVYKMEDYLVFGKDDKSDGSSVQTRSEEERDAAVDAAMAEGRGKLYQSNIVLQGPPGSGKSSLKRALLGLDPLPKEKQSATNIVENAVRAVSIDKVNNFEVIGNDKLIEMFADEVNLFPKKKNQIEIGHADSVLKGIHSLSNTRSPITTPVIEASASVLNVTDTTPVIRSRSVLSIMKALDRGTGPLKIYDTNWYHVIDSGGQPQFSDILPLVHRSPSLNIVVVRLTESLDDKPPVRFYEEGRNVYSLPDRLCLSNREMIVRMCQIAASCKASPGGVVPYVMIVGTHLDKLGDLAVARIREFNEGLKEIRKEFGDVLICKSPKDIEKTIFPINAMAEGEERREYTRELQECIITFTRQNVTPDTVPLRWLVYQLDLDKGKGVVRIKDCYKGGEPFEMNEVAVKDSLRFLSKMALVHYFPDEIPDFDFVLTKTDPLIGRLSKLVKSSFLPPEYLPPAESERLRMKGLFSKRYLSKVLSDFDSKELSIKIFLQMLQCLKIAVCVSEDEYFLPSALSLEPINVERSIMLKMSSVPLVFAWCNRFLPQGFFFTVIVELLTRNGDYKFELRTDIDQWRDEIQVRETIGKIAGGIKLTNRTKWIQVSSFGSARNCPAIQKEVSNAISKAIARFKDTGIGAPVVTTLCPLCESNDHYCLLTSDMNELTCDANNSLTDDNVPENILCWFQDQSSAACPQGNSVDQSSTAHPPKDNAGIRITPQDLPTVFKLLKINSSEWNAIGRELGVSKDFRKSLTKTGLQQTDEDKLEDVLDKWIESHCSDVTWNHLIHVLEERLNKRQLADDVKQYLKDKQI